MAQSVEFQVSQTILGLHLGTDSRWGVKAHILTVLIGKDKAGIHPQPLRMAFITGLLNLQLIQNTGTAFPGMQLPKETNGWFLKRTLL